MASCSINTPLGNAIITGDHLGIASVVINDASSKNSSSIPSELKDCVNQLSDYFEGKRRSFNLKLNPKGTAFQKKVWDALQQIPFGKSSSYLELSKSLGDSKAIRAVANANAKNPLWIIIPCHRIIGSDGNLTGYAGGLYRKQWLLNHESNITQISLF